MKDIFNGLSSLEQFILKYKNSFEKRKYFIINDKYEIIYREPSFILELASYFFENENRTEIEETIIEEFTKTYVEKEKKIERMSKLNIDDLMDRFRRSLISQEKIHSLKLGNELFCRNKDLFFSILYNIALISMDSNRLIKTYYCEKITNNENLIKNIDVRNEILRNIINYFVKSENSYINYNDENSIKYFEKNRVDLLYSKIYLENFHNIVEKYNIKNVKKIEISNIFECENLSKSKLILYKYY